MARSTACPSPVPSVPVRQSMVTSMADPAVAGGGGTAQVPGCCVARGPLPHGRHGHAPSHHGRAAAPLAPSQQRLALLPLQPLPAFTLGQGLPALRFSAHREPNERCPCSLFPLTSRLPSLRPERESRTSVSLKEDGNRRRQTGQLAAVRRLELQHHD